MVHSISLVSALSISEIQYNVFQKISIVLLSRRTAALQKARTIVTVYICNEYHKSWFKVHFKGAVASWSHARANRTYWEPGSTKTFHHRCEKHWFVANKRSRCVFLGNNACYSDASRLVLYFMCFFYVGTGSNWAHGRLLEILAALMVVQNCLKSGSVRRSIWQPHWLTGWCSSV